jgi:hypothetical protein
MPSYSETIISNQDHPGDSTAQKFVGEKVKGDGYYGRSDGLHTVQYNTDGFIGTIYMQATLAVDPTEDDWFALPSTKQVSVDADAETGNDAFVYNFTGNFVWVRAVIDNWTDGAVASIFLNH